MHQYFFQIFATGFGLVVIVFGTTMFTFGISFSILALRLRNISSQIYNHIKIRFINIMLSLLFFIILLLPFKFIFSLLGLSLYFPIVSGIYACIFSIVSLSFNNRSHLLSFINYVCIFSYAAFAAYIIFIIKDLSLLGYLFALPLLAEGVFYIEPIDVFSKTTLYMEGNNSPAPTHSPAPTNSTFFSSESSRSPSPPPTFEQ